MKNKDLLLFGLKKKKKKLVSMHPKSVGMLTFDQSSKKNCGVIQAWEAVISLVNVALVLHENNRKFSVVDDLYTKGLLNFSPTNQGEGRGRGGVGDVQTCAVDCGYFLRSQAMIVRSLALWCIWITLQHFQQQSLIPGNTAYKHMMSIARCKKSRHYSSTPSDSAPQRNLSVTVL